MNPLPLQVPGFTELAVIALIFLILALPVVLLVVLVLWLRSRSGGTQSKAETIEELETKVAELESQVEELQGENSD